MNNRITTKERNLLKGAIRRVFSRSDLRRKIVENNVIEHADNTRPRVKRWVRCKLCTKPTPKSYVEVDHLESVVPVDKTLVDMSFDELINRIWCEEQLLQPLCPDCHKEKTSLERKERSKHRKAKKNER